MNLSELFEETAHRRGLDLEARAWVLTDPVTGNQTAIVVTGLELSKVDDWGSALALVKHKILAAEKTLGVLASAAEEGTQRAVLTASPSESKGDTAALGPEGEKTEGA